MKPSSITTPQVEEMLNHIYNLARPHFGAWYCVWAWALPNKALRPILTTHIETFLVKKLLAHSEYRQYAVEDLSDVSLDFTSAVMSTMQYYHCFGVQQHHSVT